MNTAQGITIILALIGSTAAVVAAIPVVKSWLPITLSKTEKSVLFIALSNPRYPGFLQYWVHALEGQESTHVNAPYMSNHMQVTNEILSLRDKSLISAMDRLPMQHEKCVWYQLTAKGYRVAKSLKV